MKSIQVKLLGSKTDPIVDPRKQYTSMEVLYDLIKNDEKLIATLSPEAVRKYANTLLP
jgi:hypothetical protein